MFAEGRRWDHPHYESYFNTAEQKKAVGAAANRLGSEEDTWGGPLRRLMSPWNGLISKSNQ